MRVPPGFDHRLSLAPGFAREPRQRSRQTALDGAQTESASRSRWRMLTLAMERNIMLPDRPISLTVAHKTGTFAAVAETDTLLTTRQLQALLQVDRITIYRMLGDGRLRGFKVGGQWRFSRQTIERWLTEQRAVLGMVSPSESQANLQSLREGLPLSCIHAIQEIFAQALDVGTVTTEIDGRPLTSVANTCSFCSLVLDTEVGRQRCIASWRSAVAQHRGQRACTRGEDWTPLPTMCHAGLRYVSVPLAVRGQLVAATHAGQFLDSSPAAESWSVAIQALSTAIGVQAESLRRALDSVPVLDETRQEQVSRLLQHLVATFAEIGEERLDLLGRLQHIAEISRT